MTFGSKSRVEGGAAGRLALLALLCTLLPSCSTEEPQPDAQARLDATDASDARHRNVDAAAMPPDAAAMPPDGAAMPPGAAAPTPLDSGNGTSQSLLARIVQPAGFAMAATETAPDNNALTEERAQLGRRLFYDPILSRDRTVSCGSCHQQEFGFSDPRTVSVGVEEKQGDRNAPHLANLAWVRSGLFWDGRVETLEEQATQPIENPLEMDLAISDAVARLLDDASYVAAFEQAYDAPPTAQSLGAALASFVRTLVSAEAPYDRYLAGDEAALSASARRGAALFLDGKTGCFHCHSQTTLTNDGFFNNGTYEDGGDVGRQALTGRTGDLGKFRVPSLRNVAVTAPYMHDGSLATLRDVIEHYARGGSGHPSTDVQVEPLELTEEDKEDLLAFLESLTDAEFLSAAELAPVDGSTGTNSGK